MKMAFFSLSLVIELTGGSQVFGYGSTNRAWDCTMEVVEPKAIYKTTLQFATLTKSEELQALKSKISYERALRALKASRLAKNRHQGMQAWRKDMEVFLMAQRQLMPHSLPLPKSPHYLPESRFSPRPSSRPNLGPNSKSVPTLKLPHRSNAVLA
jgi:hypothetical protein